MTNTIQTVDVPLVYSNAFTKYLSHDFTVFLIIQFPFKQSDQRYQEENVTL